MGGRGEHARFLHLFFTGGRALRLRLPSLVLLWRLQSFPKSGEERGRIIENDEGMENVTSGLLTIVTFLLIDEEDVIVTLDESHS